MYPGGGVSVGGRGVVVSRARARGWGRDGGWGADVFVGGEAMCSTNSTPPPPPPASRPGSPLTRGTNIAGNADYNNLSLV